MKNFFKPAVKLLAPVFLGLAVFSCGKGCETVYFTVDVDTSLPGDTVVRMERSMGVLMAPPEAFDTQFTPPRLIIYCNSGGCKFEPGRTEIEHSLQAKYLVSKGYAVMCMAGLPESYSRRLKIDRARTAGSHVIHRACIAGYRYAMSGYNLRRDGCYLLSVSTGGLAALNLLNLSDIPVLAAAGINPLTSTAENAWYVPSGSSSGGEFDSLQYRSNIIRIFGMKDAATLSELEKARYEKDKVGIYDPYDYCLNRSDKPLRAPYLVFSHVDDKVVRRGIIDTLACVMNARREASVLVSDVQEYGHGINCPQELPGVLLFDGHIHRLNLTTKLIFMFFEKYRYDGPRTDRHNMPVDFSEHAGDVIGRVPGSGKP